MLSIVLSYYLSVLN
ncbi:hypothetical protein RDI58_015094 [Solanum bulbocastanum]|uniref:Uncharacterized protein n=1 Tax=Solanum bulbocastanum TaxID=147425 RepID=A0AAN8TEP0_SOLBU